MKYFTNNIDIAIRRKLHKIISFLNQTFEMLSTYIKILRNFYVGIKGCGIILPKGLL